jgi:hypothetical protein
MVGHQKVRAESPDACADLDRHDILENADTPGHHFLYATLPGVGRQRLGNFRQNASFHLARHLLIERVDIVKMAENRPQPYAGAFCDTGNTWVIFSAPDQLKHGVDDLLPVSFRPQPAAVLDESPSFFGTVHAHLYFPAITCEPESLQGSNTLPPSLARRINRIRLEERFTVLRWLHQMSLSSRITGFLPTVSPGLRSVRPFQC